MSNSTDRLFELKVGDINAHVDPDLSLHWVGVKFHLGQANCLVSTIEDLLIHSGQCERATTTSACGWIHHSDSHYSTSILQLRLRRILKPCHSVA